MESPKSLFPVPTHQDQEPRRVFLRIKTRVNQPEKRQT